MIKMIDVSAINSDGKYINKYGGELRFLYGLNKLNIFVGENNSSKSRMMRLLMNSKGTNYYSNDVNVSYKTNMEKYVNRIFETLKNMEAKVKDTNIFFDKKDWTGIYSSIFEYINSDDVNSTKWKNNDNIALVKSDLKNVFEYIKNTKIQTNYYNIDKIDKTYIPVLRGIEKFSNYYDDEYISRIINTISMNGNQRGALSNFINNSDKVYNNKISKIYEIEKNMVFTGENLFDDISSKLLGKNEERELIYGFQNFISKQFYDGIEFEIIPQLKTKVINVKIGEIEHELHNIGDGIKQLITILYPIYTQKDYECLFFIEEPEINLHPGYQRKLINLLSSNIFNKHQYFITTHSNHIIDLSIDFENISIYKFINNKNDTFMVSNTTNKDIELLNILGVNNSSVLLANCIILVEGISDKIIIKKYLDIYLGDKNNYQEDVHYSFLEYSGNNIAHWSFEDTDEVDKIRASGIMNRAFIIVDNDNDNKQERKTNLKKVFDDNFYELSYREIENTISRKVLDKTFIKNGTELINDYKESDYQNKEIYMGDFIDSHYNLSKKWSNKNSDGKGTGTISNKLEFARLVSNNIETKDDLSAEAIKICEKLISFIEKSNK